MKTSKFLRVFVVSSAMLSLGACAEQGSSPTAATDPNLSPTESGTRGPTLSSPTRSYTMLASSREHAVGEAVAKTLALALRDPAVGQEIKQAFASSAVNEHKLHLTSFLQGRGGKILAAGYRAAGNNERQFQSEMAELRQLEFYMPVEEHRRKWSGGPDVLVAIAISKGDAPVAFTTDGVRVQLNAKSRPSTPTLVITNIETDFREQIKINERGMPAFGCQGDESESLETSAGRCERSINRTPNSGVASVLGQHGAAVPAAGNFIPTLRNDLSSDAANLGLYANFIGLDDAKEFWFQGDPEVEIHVTGKRNGPTGHPIDYQCAGEHANDPNGNQPGIRDFSYVFDQNANSWSGDVRILNAFQVDSLRAAEPAGFNISMWEDDSEGPCNMHENQSGDWANAVAAAAAVSRGVNAIKPDTGSIQWRIIAGVVSELAALVQGGDDMIGTLVLKDSTAYAGQFPGNTHIIFDAANFNGRATLYMKRTDRSAGINGPTQLASGQDGNWFASAGPPSGQVNYTWWVDGTQVQDGPSSGYSRSFTGDPFEIDMVARDSQGTIGGAGIFVTGCADPTQIQCDPSGGGSNINVPTSRPVSTGLPSGKKVTGVRGGKK